MEISSIHNPKVKQVVVLQQKSSERRKSGLFVVEGRRELMHCLNAGYECHSLFVKDSLSESLMKEDPWLKAVPEQSVYTVSDDVYSKMAYREGTEGVVAVMKGKNHSLEQLTLSDNPLIIVLERVEKPGNLGAVLRTADAAHADAVIVCDPLTDLYNPNLIRSSIGAIFTVPCVACSSSDCIDFLKSHDIQILTAQLQDSKLYYNTSMTVPTAIVMGTESTGLTELWRNAADAHIRIPMLGALDSLNVSVSTAILLFEAVRQRQKVLV